MAYYLPGAGRIAQGTQFLTSVRPGDTLWGLAAYHLGSGERWREIFDLSTELVQLDGRRLTDPNLIVVGWFLLVPTI